ncbi:MAG: exodeoxyribonuclease VII small subunit [Calditrichales bacterium]|nr:MAG: exodeoxyribonuclease VII small subunit [Calditrichales bacterium]
MENSIPLEELSYEKAFSELEQIVNRMESETQNLEDSLLLYERGQALAQYCAGLLEKAEIRMEQLKIVSDNFTESED